MEVHQFPSLIYTLHYISQLIVVKKMADPLPCFHLYSGGLSVNPLLYGHGLYYTENTMIPSSFITGIDCLCIDASSMIYHLKIGLLGSLAAEITLISTPGVIKEVGWPHLPVTSRDISTGTYTNDESLVILASREKVPVLSEDKEILTRAGELGLEYYNTLMMLNYLLLKGRVMPEEYPEYLTRLIECSHYSDAVLSTGHAVHAEVLEIIESL